MYLNIPKFGFYIKRGFSEFKQFYTKNHEWIKICGTSDSSQQIIRVKIGITDYSQKALGDIVFIEMPKVESRYSAEGKSYLNSFFHLSCI